MHDHPDSTTMALEVSMQQAAHSMLSGNNSGRLLAEHQSPGEVRGVPARGSGEHGSRAALLAGRVSDLPGKACSSAFSLVPVYAHADQSAC